MGCLFSLAGYISHVVLSHSTKHNVPQQILITLYVLNKASNWYIMVYITSSGIICDKQNGNDMGKTIFI